MIPNASFGRVALCALALSVAVSTPLHASDLTLDGQTQVTVPLGTTLQLAITGTPGADTFLALDLDGGPTDLFNMPVSLGFTPAFTSIPLGPMPPSGELSFPITVPNDDEFIGLDVFFLGVVADEPKAKNWDYSNGAVLSIGRRDVELASRPLAVYPDAEFVRAFNEGESVSVTIDPNRWPALAGVTADVYVTAPRTASEWDADATLVDVRGAPTSITFSGVDVASNTFVVDTGTLSADAGASLGVGYDLVIDANGDGLLDDGDLLDGYADEAGFYVVHDVTQPGPYPVTETIYSGGTFLGQNLFYPSNIAELGVLKLLVVSHGNGHNYQWYDHIGAHLASYGFVVMSHQNNTIPGIETASTTTLTNTDYFLGNLDIIEGGVLEGHIDTDNIAWIGHSRGGEGVVRAYKRLLTDDFVPANYDESNIVFVSSIAPTVFLTEPESNSEDVDYHIWVGGADSDVNGCSQSKITQSFILLGRASDRRQGISLHGVGHGVFHNGNGIFANGPCQVSRADTHTLMRGYILPLMTHHLRGNVPAEDFLWRQWEAFRPIGAPDFNPCVVVDLQYRERAETGKFVIDDFQTNDDLATSSSGGAVTLTVLDPVEDRWDDPDNNFTFSEDEPFNGFTYAAGADDERGLVFEWNGGPERTIRYDLVTEAVDATKWAYLSFRAAQATRDPLTGAVLEDLTFTVELEDRAGVTSAIGIGAYGGGIEEPYQRTGCGTGVGWASEFETIKIRLTDFTHDNDLDLRDLSSITFRFGPTAGSNEGRLGFDDLEFVTE